MENLPSEETLLRRSWQDTLVHSSSMVGVHSVPDLQIDLDQPEGTNVNPPMELTDGERLCKCASRGDVPSLQR